jgi:hypothetical protein
MAARDGNLPRFTLRGATPFLISARKLGRCVGQPDEKPLYVFSDVRWVRAEATRHPESCWLVKELPRETVNFPKRLAGLYILKCITVIKLYNEHFIYYGA